MHHPRQSVGILQLRRHLHIFLILLSGATGLSGSALASQPDNPKTIDVRLSSTDQEIRNQLLDITSIGTPLGPALEFASVKGRNHGMPDEITVCSVLKMRKPNLAAI